MSAQVPEFSTKRDQQDSKTDLYLTNQLLASEAALLAACDLVTGADRARLIDALWIIRRVRSRGR